MSARTRATAPRYASVRCAGLRSPPFRPTLWAFTSRGTIAALTPETCLAIDPPFLAPINSTALRLVSLSRRVRCASLPVPARTSFSCMAVPPTCPFRQVRDPVALFEVNPGIGTPEVSGSWPQLVGCDDFPRRRAPPSSRDKIAAPRGPPLPLRSIGDAACPSAAYWFTDKAAMGATL